MGHSMGKRASLLTLKTSTWICTLLQYSEAQVLAAALWLYGAVGLWPLQHPVKASKSQAGVKGCLC